MKSTFFHSPTILIITDRTDLDDQLSKQFVASKKYIGDETVVSIDSREKLRQELQGRTSGGVYMTTIQKFTEDLELLTDRANVICISDEAHRSQINLDQKVKVTAEGVERSYGFAKYLHDSLPMLPMSVSPVRPWMVRLNLRSGCRCLHNDRGGQRRYHSQPCLRRTRCTGHS